MLVGNSQNQALAKSIDVYIRLWEYYFVVCVRGF